MNSILKLTVLLALLSILFSCSQLEELSPKKSNPVINVLNYIGTPKSHSDRNSLSFSDQGAWFSYGFSEQKIGGFSGPFLMTQSNGTWSSPCLSKLELTVADSIINFKNFTQTTTSFTSHLENRLEHKDLEIIQELFFATDKSSVIRTTIFNKSNKAIEVQPNWSGQLIDSSLFFTTEQDELYLHSNKSETVGHIQFYEKSRFTLDSLAYNSQLVSRSIPARSSIELFTSHSFQEIPDSIEQRYLLHVTRDFKQQLAKRKEEKEQQLSQLSFNPAWDDSVTSILGTKAILTLQNNWRSPSGELKHSGLFPSYHYEWFHGFWAWDSWKHSAALAYINPELAKEQIKAMYDYRDNDGFVPDCIFRDTTDEPHNYRNTKAPLSAWAVYEIFSVNQDTSFILEMYSHLQLQHHWWYSNRDHDKDGLCEYGSTDGSLVAAKWESGMDNAVRFDNSKILKNKENAYSLDQESVDLNAYLYAEKIYLAKMAVALNSDANAKQYFEQAEKLKTAIQEQFFDEQSGWFYDTDLSGKNFIKVMGCEGWIPLWANVATLEQASHVKEQMMNKSTFNTAMPLQTLSADHPKFKPNRGYWRGPNWIDQSYFGIRGLYNYNFKTEAHELATKLVYNAEGLIQKGPSIRENYQPLTGEGLEAQNFSWSAAHYLLLLMEK